MNVLITALDVIPRRRRRRCLFVNRRSGWVGSGHPAGKRWRINNTTSPTRASPSPWGNPHLAVGRSDAAAKPTVTERNFKSYTKNEAHSPTTYEKWNAWRIPRLFRTSRFYSLYSIKLLNTEKASYLVPVRASLWLPSAPNKWPPSTLYHPINIDRYEYVDKMMNFAPAYH